MDDHDFEIRRVTIEPSGRDQWFSPAVGALPRTSGHTAILLTQPCYADLGSDNFGTTHQAFRDVDGVWSSPGDRPIMAMARTRQTDGGEMSYVGMHPQWFPAHDALVAIGTNVWYDRAGRLTRPYQDRQVHFSINSIGADGLGEWDPTQTLEWQPGRDAGMYYASLLQPVHGATNELLQPIQYAIRTGSTGTRLAATTLKCRFDGATLAVVDTGSTLTIDHGRGLFEPSLAVVGNDYYLTMRAEDDCAYLSHSSDGLHWEDPRPWRWAETGETVRTGTTQQHWLQHSEATYLVYTRATEHNTRVFRWRSPLFIARVDPATGVIFGTTEREVFATVTTDQEPEHWPTFGNFSTCHVDPHISLVADTAGKCHIAEIHWRRPNELARRGD